MALYKTFLFRTRGYHHTTIAVEIATKLPCGDYSFREVVPSEASYNRFVALVNSGQYTAEIRPYADEMSWEITRC